MDLRKKKVKSLRNIRTEAVRELKLCPQKLTNDYFYSFMRLNAFKLSNTPYCSKPTTPTPPSNPLNKHKRDPHEFLRSCSPSKRRPVINSKSSSSSQKSPRKSSINLNPDLSSFSRCSTLIYNEKEFVDLCMLGKDIQGPEYRRKYDRMFKGKISRNYLKFDT